jgi:hypothetical protein
MDLEKSFKLPSLMIPARERARRRKLATFSTSNNSRSRILGAEELPMDVIRRDERRGRNRQTSDEHVNILLRLKRLKYKLIDMILLDKDF